MFRNLRKALYSQVLLAKFLRVVLLEIYDFNERTPSKTTTLRSLENKYTTLSLF